MESVLRERLSEAKREGEKTGTTNVKGGKKRGRESKRARERKRERERSTLTDRQRPRERKKSLSLWK